MAGKLVTVHQAIVLAERKGVGVRLSVEEVQALCDDGAILQCAENDDECKHRVDTDTDTDLRCLECGSLLRRL